jgi:hypothetical protein
MVKDALRNAALEIPGCSIHHRDVRRSSPIQNFLPGFHGRKFRARQFMPNG